MGIYELLNLLFLFCAVFLVAFLLMDRVQSGMQELREHQAAVGQATVDELWVNMSPDTFLVIRLILALLLFMVGYTAINTVLGVFLAVAGYAVPGWYVRRLRYKRIRKLESQLVEGLELMGNALKSGLTLPQAVELLVREFPPPISQEFSLVLSENRLGVDFTDALARMGERLNSTIVHILVSGVAITKRCGGDLTEIFQNIAATIREQALIEGKLEAVTAQGRFQGVILSIMPFALIVVLYFIDRAHVGTLFGYQMGIFAVLTVVGMVFMAQVWINHLLKIDV